MRTVLVPTDFSENAANAVDYACKIANSGWQRLVLVHVINPVLRTDLGIPVEKILESEARNNLEALKNKVRPLLNKTISLDAELAVGSTVEKIAELAEKTLADLVIMGTQGASGLKELFLGSNTNGLVLTGKVPVLAIPNSYPFNPLQKLALAVDSDGVSQPGILAPLKFIARQFGARIMVYHLERGENDLGMHPSISAFLEDSEQSFHYEISSQDVSQAIESFVEDYQVDLLCMIRRKKSRLEHLFHVSATAREVFHSTVPLLILQD